MDPIVATILSGVLGGLIGGLLAFPLARYQAKLQAGRDLRPLGTKLAALTIRARQEVVNQFLKTSAGSWVPAALERQRFLHQDLESLVTMAQAHGGDLHVCLWAAREALESNMAVLDSWLRYDRPPSLDQVSADMSSHFDIVAVAYLLARATETINDTDTRKDAHRFAVRAAEVRMDAAKDSKKVLTRLEELDARARSLWVRTGHIESRRLE